VIKLALDRAIGRTLAGGHDPVCRVDRHARGALREARKRDRARIDGAAHERRGEVVAQLQRGE